MNIENLNLEELNNSELNSVNGGWWYVIGGLAGLAYLYEFGYNHATARMAYW